MAASPSLSKTACGSRPGKACFITVGATAPFDELVKAALCTSFLDALIKHNFTDLIIQWGNVELATLRTLCQDAQAGNLDRDGLRVRGFDFNRIGLGQEMRATKQNPGGVEGVVISHAGMILMNSREYQHVD